jgi:hypothetical protein
VIPVPGRLEDVNLVGLSPQVEEIAPRGVMGWGLDGVSSHPGILRPATGWRSRAVFNTRTAPILRLKAVTGAIITHRLFQDQVAIANAQRFIDYFELRLGTAVKVVGGDAPAGACSFAPQTGEVTRRALVIRTPTLSER